MEILPALNRIKSLLPINYDHVTMAPVNKNRSYYFINQQCIILLEGLSTYTLSKLNTSLLSRQSGWQQLLEAMRTVKQEHIFPPQLFGQYLTLFMQSLPQMKEQKAAVEAGLR